MATPTLVVPKISQLRGSARSPTCPELLPLMRRFHRNLVRLVKALLSNCGSSWLLFEKSEVAAAADSLALMLLSHLLFSGDILILLLEICESKKTNYPVHFFCVNFQNSPGSSFSLLSIFFLSSNYPFVSPSRFTLNKFLPPNQFRLHFIDPFFAVFWGVL